MKVTVGKRYEWSITMPCDGRRKNGLLVNVDDNGMATLMTKNGQEWYVYVGDLKSVK